MFRTLIHVAAVVGAGAVLATACGGSNNATGTGGSSAGTSGTAGAGGMAGGGGTTGGTAGDAGTNGTGGTGGSAATGTGAFTGTPDAGDPYAATCASTVKNKGTCVTATDVPCANTCGPNRSGYKNCNCYSDVWDCPRCEYPAGDYSCYRLPDPLEACPLDPVESLPPMVGTSCTRAACSPCGSATLISYRDSGGSLKVGYCVCGNEQKWTCASTSEWPQLFPDAGT
jgi:hypothetical protein